MYGYMQIVEKNGNLRLSVVVVEEGRRAWSAGIPKVDFMLLKFSS